ncbi:Hydrolase (HAD superfamily), YqeK [Candidatus Syntrophocurvum alkaliphilum]|uniref:bis(5'-nucleosyl)-tetraphosphatase (symmetrical) n=2 Tax=Candidatus Syntrophocurvum alkaliphilum TaxID=2293317 RepID=A0A6I6DFY6_9FIRM|nr:Hydrolase (HAD superfamily), YqeK [Candidatus Syntrophocurvum alkaliphilum]
MINAKDAVNIIKFKLSYRRFNHSVEVAKVAEEMAYKFGIDTKKAYITGLLHDYAKGIPSDELLKIAELNDIIEDEVERLVPDLLHAPVGSFLIKEELNIKDKELLRAVELHTLGSEEMSDLEKIIFLADMIEPGRDYPGLERLKCLAMRNLDEAMLYGLNSTILYCIDQKRIIHPRSIKARNHFLWKNYKENEFNLK